MILCFPGNTFDYEYNYPLLDENGSALDTSYYSTTAPSFTNATKVDRFVLTLTDITGYESGDQITIRQDGFDTNNVVAMIDKTGKKIRLETPLIDSSSTFSVAKGKYSYLIKNNCPEAFYRFKNGEAILVRSAIQSMSVDYASVITRDVSLSTQLNPGSFKNTNKEAINSVYADLCHLPNVWNVIDLGQFREMIVLKILAIAELGKHDSIKHGVNYESFRTRVINMFMLDDTGSTPTSDIKQNVYDSYNIGLGA